MDNITYSPQTTLKKDKVESVLRTISQNILIAIFGLLPLIFIPLAYLPIDYGKIVFVSFAVLVSIIFFCLSILRSGELKLSFPLPLLALWGIAAVAIIASFFSGDIRDSILGDYFGVYTSIFAVITAVVATVLVLFGQSKTGIMKLYLLLSGSAFVLAIFHIVRLFVGSDLLYFGPLSNAISSTVGGWNQLGLFFGLVILLSLMAVEQLPLTKWGKSFFSVLTVLSLIILAIVNFTPVWAVLAAVSLVMLMFSLTKDRFSNQAQSSTESRTSIQSIITLTLVFIFSLLFIFWGSFIGTQITKWTDINYTEVRPSLTATVDIAKNVYKENIIVGNGPNNFIDAWRLYKDPSLNATIFWNSDFVAGSGHLPTLFVGTGLLGIFAFIIFLAFWFRAGLKVFTSPQKEDRFWSFTASSSFVAATYILLMSFFYTSATTMLLLLAVFIGVFSVAYINIVKTKSLNLSVMNKKWSIILMIGLVMVTIVASTAGMYLLAKHYVSVATYSRAVVSLGAGADFEEVQANIVEAYNIYNNNSYLSQLARYQAIMMGSLLQIPEPTPAEQQSFQQAAANGLSAINLVIGKDGTNASNYAIQGIIYGNLAAAGVEGSMEKALESIANARKYDPTNPEYYLLEAQIWLRGGDQDKARESLDQALQLKPNYINALSLIAQLEIATGNTDQAILATEAIVLSDINNPASHYQLGVLYLSSDRLAEAVKEFQAAVTLDKDYANARYFMAVAFARLDKNDEALEQLTKVQELNPDNAMVAEAIAAVKSGQFGRGDAYSDGQPVEDGEEGATEKKPGITKEDLESPLVTSVNPVTGETANEQASDTETNSSNE